jgi:hypothetical protein
LPFLIGISFALADVLVFEVIIRHPEYTTLPPFLQPFPYSVILYTSGAVYVEILHRLLPLTLIMFVSIKYFSGKYTGLVFWAAAFLTSVWEPLEQLPDGSTALIIYSFASGFAFNFLQAIFYKKSGWPAALFVRLGHYLIWHILLGIYLQIFVL